MSCTLPRQNLHCRNLRWLRSALAVVVVAFGLGDLRADVRLPAIVSDHMVLQSGAAAPLWGWADAGEQVAVMVAGQTQTATAGSDGRWKVVFSDLKAGGPHTLKVQGKNSLTVDDVLVGEVWLCSGQSNMAMNVGASMNFDQEQAAANYPQLRMFKVDWNPKPESQSECTGRWTVCTPEAVKSFSATAYFFGRGLHQALKMPVGLINTSSGGTAVEAWTSMDAQSKLAEYPTIYAPWAERIAQPWDEAKAMAGYEKQLAAWKEKAVAAKKSGEQPPRQPKKPVDPRLDQNHPSNLYNGMIAPLIPYGIRGAIWYQGESNSAKPFANLYGLQLKTMIADWRARWGYDFPFAWVQLPDFRKPQEAPVEAQTWPIIREQMLNSLSIPHTGMAIALGLGEEKDIHPKNKQGVGQRLAAWALVDVYRRPGASSGPLPAGHEVRGNTIVVRFRHADGGLQTTSGEVRGFAIAGADQKFVWANARIDGERVIVSSPDVPQPVAVRYAWADNPVWSLQNGAGIPASPFRTDDWPLVVK